MRLSCSFMQRCRSSSQDQVFVVPGVMISSCQQFVLKAKAVTGRLSQDRRLFQTSQITAQSVSPSRQDSLSDRKWRSEALTTAFFGRSPHHMSARSNSTFSIDATRIRGTLIQHRHFSSRGKKRKPKDDSLIANEKLIQALIKLNPQSQGPDDIQIRLVIDEGPETESTVQVCSLAEGIEVSLDRMADLIGTSLQAVPPVVRVAQLSKIEYQKEQAASKQKSNAKTKQKKTFRFRAGIEEHDLDRKLQDMIKFLGRGMECEYTVFSKARTMRANADAGMHLVDRIQELVAHCATLKRPPAKNETGNHIRVILVPKKS